MKIKTTVTEIECSANELRQSNTLSDSLYNLLRGCFNNMTSDCEEPENEKCEDEECEIVNLGNGVFKKRYKEESENKE